jgi:hypothetical protein
VIQEEYVERKSYGIAVIIPDDSCIVKRVSDLSCDFKMVSELVKLCNEFHLDPNQLDDVVEDFLFTL